MVMAPTSWGLNLNSFLAYFETHLPLIVSIWLTGVLFFTLRMIGGLTYLQVLRHRHVQPLPTYWQDRLKDLSRQLRMRPGASLIESALVKTPMVIGYFKPVILFPDENNSIK